MRKSSRNTNTEPRTLGKNSAVNHEGKRQALIDVALAYVIYAVRHDIPAYIGTITTTGGIRVKFYGDDDPSQVYISTTDDVESIMPDQMSDLLEKEVTWDALCRMAPWLAEAARELRKRGPTREAPVSIPERPQKPAQ